MKRYLLPVAFAAAALLAGCGSDHDGPDPDPNPPTPPAAKEWLAKGADISWLTEMEAEGVKFRFPSGRKGDCLEILKGTGINAVRLRLWVDPEDSYCSLPDVLEKCRRAESLGLDVMLDFHYSDSWADPSQQTVPAKWQGLDLQQLVAKVGDYTREACIALRDAGISPLWVQAGNETGNGMLWPLGKADTNPDGYVALNNAAYDAVKSVFPDAKVIVHLQNGQDESLFQWLFDILRTRGGKYDVIGMSLYPEPDNYIDYLAKTEANIKACISRYDKDVMLCEVGMGEAYAAQCRAFLDGCLALADAIPGRRFIGVFYWEPQCYGGWKGYTKGAFTSIGSPGTQMGAFSFTPRD